jgi:hypothetical protein
MTLERFFPIVSIVGCLDSVSERRAKNHAGSQDDEQI